MGPRRGRGTVLCDTVMMDTRHYTYVQTTRSGPSPTAGEEGLSRAPRPRGQPRALERLLPDIWSQSPRGVTSKLVRNAESWTLPAPTESQSAFQHPRSCSCFRSNDLEDFKTEG